MIAASLSIQTPKHQETGSTDIAQLKQRYVAAGQGHLFAFFDELSQEEQQNLVQQLSALNVERVNRIHQKATTCPSPMLNNQAAQIAPLPEECFDSIMEAEKDKVQEWTTLGLNQISQNKVGTRLGSSAPKGCYNIGLPSSKPLFQLQAERILKLQRLAQQQPGAVANVTIPWYVMTSGPTRAATMAYFEENGYFGLESKNIVFFEQGTLPCLTFDGKIMMESKSQIAVAPDGNGGVYAALRGTGVLADMAERKVEFLHAYCVDNCLVRVADPVFIGYCYQKNADCGAKVVRKLSPTESVGVVCLRNSAFNVIEYSEINDDVAHAINPKNGQLLYGASNIVNHFYTLDFLNRVEAFEGDLEYHIARKKIKTVDMQTGDIISPKAPNGMKLEMFVFDVFPFTERMAVFEVDRREEFSPLKNAPGSGSDCPETSRRDILQQNIRFIEAAGGKVVVGEDDVQQENTPTLELSPLVTYAGEGLAEIVAGKSIKTPAKIASLEELKLAVF
ncbi:UDP-N-acetylglucosamine pyrophosphorylase [Mortierella sp. GBA43]|nr:UDP-N-acetylglucosamine pyrophosphorylase [Mortierella sp. GBA43]